jgi:MFS family permease
LRKAGGPINKLEINKNLTLLLAGRVVSDLGSSIQYLIMPLYILDMGGSAKTIGLFSFLYILPILLIFPFGGVIGDRLNRKKIMVTSDLMSGLIVLALAYLAYSNRLNIGLLLVFQVFVSLFYGFFDPATKGMIPQIVKRDNLSKANSKVASFRILAGMMAPLIAVTLYMRFGITLLFLINGVSFLLSALSETFIDYHHIEKNVEIKMKSILADLGEGIKFIVNAKMIFSFCLFFFVINAMISPLFSVVLPLFFRTILDYTDTVYGYLQTMLFMGALVGSLLAGVVAKDNTLGRVLTRGIMMISGSIFLYAMMLQPMTVSFLGNDTIIYFIIFGFCLFLLYTSMMLVGIPLQTLIQKETPEDYMSRVFSIVSLITKGGAPFGALVYGFMMDKVEIHISVMMIAIVIGLISMRYVKKLRQQSV